MTHTQFVLLAGIAYLNEREDFVSQVMLASHAGTDPMTTSTVVRTLLRKQYITRMESNQDSRSKLLSLSNRGRAIIQQALQKVQNIDKEVFQMSNSEKSKWMNILKMIFKNNCT